MTPQNTSAFTPLKVGESSSEFRRVQYQRPNQMEGLAQPDGVLVLTLLALLVFGLIMLASASVDVGVSKGGSSTYFLYRQLGALVVTILACAVIYARPAMFMEGTGKYFLWVSLILLLLIFTPLGTTINGSRRWLRLGITNFQASEFVKFAFLLFFADFLANNREDLQQKPWFALTTLGIPTGLWLVLLLKQPDFGSTVLIVATLLGLLFIANLRLSIFIELAIGMLIVGILLIIQQPYRLKRFFAFLDPFAHRDDEGYQLVHSLIAVASNGWKGRGLGESVQKYEFLPEGHNDFIFAVINEELGFFGGLFVIFIFFMIMWRCFKIGNVAMRVRRASNAYYAWGVGIMMFVQAMIHICVNIGAFPTKGLTLPFISYGGSSVLMTGIMFALLLRIDAECREQARREGKLE